MKKGILFLASLAASQLMNAQIILSQSFNTNAIPSGWTQTTFASDGGWKFGPRVQMEGLNMHFPPTTGSFACTSDEQCQCNKSADRLISPSMNLSTYTTVYVSTDYLFTTDFNWTALTLEVSTNGGATWTVVANIPSGGWDWEHRIYDLSPYVGQSNVKISYLFNDMANVNDWKGAAIRNVQVFVPFGVDLSTDKVKLKSDSKVYEVNMIKMNPQDTVFGVLRNRGTTTITSLDLHYRVDGGAVQTQTLSGLNIAPLATYNYTHNVYWNFNNPGIRKVKVWADNINGGNDLNMVNDTGVKVTGVATSTVNRRYVFEVFTNSGCGPCVGFNNSVLPVVNNNAAIMNEISYHVYWPSSNDPMYQFNTADNITRKNYYLVGGVPQGYVDGISGIYGVSGGSSLTSWLNYEMPKPGFFNLSVNSYYTGSNINISGNWNSLGDFVSGTFKLHVVLTETKSYTAAPGPNGETYFPHAMRKMFPDGNGTALSLPTSTSSGSFNFSYPYSASQINVNNCQVVAFIQDNYNRYIFQAATSQLLPLGTNDELAGVNDLKLYPNPSHGIMHLDLELVKEQEVSFQVMDLLGAKVLEDPGQVLQAGPHQMLLNVSELPAGIYLVNVNAGGRVLTRKICVE